MSKTKHRQKIFGWNPPKMPMGTGSTFDHPQNVVSATECTGLVQQPLQDILEAKDLSSLMGIHSMKTQGNIGKGNPRNNPSEIAFHRDADDLPRNHHPAQDDH